MKTAVVYDHRIGEFVEAWLVDRGGQIEVALPAIPIAIKGTEQATQPAPAGMVEIEFLGPEIGIAS